MSNENSLKNRSAPFFGTLYLQTTDIDSKRMMIHMNSYTRRREVRGCGSVSLDIIFFELPDKLSFSKQKFWRMSK